MHVEIVSAAGIKQSAHILIRLIRGTELNGAGTCQGSVKVVAGRCTGKHTDLKRISFTMLFFRSLGNGFRNNFRTACRRKSAESDMVVVIYIRGSLFGRDEFK